MTVMERARQMALAALRRTALLRSRSYKRVFMPEGEVDRDREVVLADLREFCRATTSTFSPDPYAAARLAGRREAWLRIMQHLTLDEERIRKFVELDDGLDDD